MRIYVFTRTSISTLPTTARSGPQTAMVLHPPPDGLIDTTLEAFILQIQQYAGPEGYVVTKARTNTRGGAGSRGVPRPFAQPARQRRGGARANIYTSQDSCRIGSRGTRGGKGIRDSPATLRSDIQVQYTSDWITD